MAVLVLGGLGVLQTGLVTVRRRIRGIGVRRGSGATSARVSAVMLGSVCATAPAGPVPAVIAVRVKVIDAIRF